MTRFPLIVGAVLVAALAAFALAAAPKPEPKPLLQVGKRYEFLCPGERKRTAEVAEELGGGWYKVKYKHEDGAERIIWLNLNQVVYFHPAAD